MENASFENPCSTEMLFSDEDDISLLPPSYSDEEEECKETVEDLEKGVAALGLDSSHSPDRQPSPNNLHTPQRPSAALDTFCPISGINN